MLKKLIRFAIFPLFAASIVPISEAAGKPTSDPQEAASAYTFSETEERVRAAIHAAGFTVIARIDHQAGARDVGLTMPPTVVIIYGNPKGGTPLMLSAPILALDLPVKLLIREEADGKVVVAFHPAINLIQAVQLPDSAASKLTQVESNIVAAIL